MDIRHDPHLASPRQIIVTHSSDLLDCLLFYDICIADCCGMYTVKLQDQRIDFEKIDEACHYVPSGRNVWEGRMERFDLTSLKCYRALRDAKRLERSLGTLGGGNHFIEIDQAKDGTYYLVIHSGSRNLGRPSSFHSLLLKYYIHSKVIQSIL